MRSFAILLAAISAATIGYAQGPTSESGGDATFFTPGLGSCGIVNNSDDFIVALDIETMDEWLNGGTNPNLNPICGRQVQVTTSTGASVVVTVEDTCPTCSFGSVDLSPIAFDQLADPSVGRIHDISWVLL